MDEAERQLLADGLRRAVNARRGADLDDALAAVGWHDALADDPRAAVVELFERQGAAGAVSSALDAVLVHGLGLTPAPGVAVVLPHPDAGHVVPAVGSAAGRGAPAEGPAGSPADGSPAGGSSADGSPTGSSSAAGSPADGSPTGGSSAGGGAPADGSAPPVPPGRLAAGRLSLHGLATAGLGSAERVLVVASNLADPAAPGPGAAVVAVDLAVADAQVGKVTGLDPWLGLLTVDGSAVPVEALEARSLDPGSWAEAVRLGRLALGHELVGSASAMLALATDHARQRVQFGQPIAGFQAVRHRLAEALVAVEAARAALDAAWERPTPQSAAMAKALAGTGARTVARHCQQVLAGIGFTAEHPFHRHLRRALVLDELLGSARTLTRALGEAVLAGGQLPPHPAL